MLYPILPLFLAQVLKANGSVVGLVEGVAEATQNIIQGFSGSLADRLQRRKPIALAGYLLSALAKPLMGAAAAWQGLLGGRFLDRLGAGARSAPRDALIAASVDEATPAHRSPYSPGQKYRQSSSDSAAHDGKSHPSRVICFRKPPVPEVLVG
jgi:MFS family permease